MNIPFEQMPANAKLWIYAANRKLTVSEQETIRAKGALFVTGWTAHQQQLKAAFAILHDVFLIIAVDENYSEVSGCGIDKSVHFMQEIDREYNINVFNRLQIELFLNEDLLLTNKQKLAVMLQEGTVNEQTPVFNKTVTDKDSFDKYFQKTLGQSWVYPSLKALQSN
ncbi:MAG: hypothetical protein V4590_02220 [Bacteroidota bacterium]